MAKVYKKSLCQKGTASFLNKSPDFLKPGLSLKFYFQTYFIYLAMIECCKDIYYLKLCNGCVT
jgi:hypothetical protein